MIRFRPYLTLNSTHSPPVFSSSFNRRPHGTSNRSWWWSCWPLRRTHSSRAWGQCSPPRQARVRLPVSHFFPFPLATTFVTTLTFSFMGGNSTKATSGINGAGTQTQQDHGIADSSKIFFDDTKHSVRILWISGLNSTEILVLCRLVISRVMTSSTSSLAAQATP
jgi:hypothetical protein